MTFTTCFVTKVVMKTFERSELIVANIPMLLLLGNELWTLIRARNSRVNNSSELPTLNKYFDTYQFFYDTTFVKNRV
jgi:hypothetical protein